MNIAIISQGGGKYLFSVPENITLSEGEKVKCDTRRGITDGIVYADSVKADEPVARLIGNLTGAKFPLKGVVGRIVTSVEMFEPPVEDKPDPKPSQEPVKLYCVKNSRHGVSCGLTKGKVYEFNSKGQFVFDDFIDTSKYTSFPDFSRCNPNAASCLAPLVQRHAKVGEYVLITGDEVEGAKKGEICEVVSINNLSADKKPYLRTKENTVYGWPGIMPCTLARNDQYLVLDGYSPEIGG